jgi:hypothetical protein
MKQRRPIGYLTTRVTSGGAGIRPRIAAYRCNHPLWCSVGGVALSVLTLGGILGIVGAPSAYAASVTQPSITVTNPGTSAQSTYTLGLSTSSQGALDPTTTNATINISAPNGTDFSSVNSVAITDNTDPAGSVTCQYCFGRTTNNNTFVIYPRNPIGANNSLTITIDGVTNPSTASSSDTLLVSTSADTTPIASTPYGIEPLSVTRPVVSIADNSLGATTNYVLSFSTSSGGSLTNYNPSITILAPNGTDFSSVNSVAITDNTDPAGSVTCQYCFGRTTNNNTFVIYPRNPIGANNSLTITIDGVTNPSTASSSDTLLISTSADTTPIASAPYGIGVSSPGQNGTAVTSVPLTRLAGINRDATSVAVSQNSFPSTGSAGAVVLASDADYPDALAGTPLAVAKHAPLLLTPPSALDPAVAAEIQRVLPKGGSVYLLGGSAALSDATASAVQAMGYSVNRLSGSTRFGTAVAIAGALGNPTTVIEATGLGFADGLSAGAAAAAAHAAVLLTNGTSQAPESAAYLAAHPGTRYAAGGPACQADPSATCLAGANRFDTSVLVAQHFFSSPPGAGFASGLAFPDALSGGASIGARSGPIILVPSSGSLPASVVGYLSSAKTISVGYIYGGSSAVGSDVGSEIG